MTDTLKGCTVVFEGEIRVDEAEALLTAIRMLKGVCRVEPVLTDNGEMFTQMRIDREVAEFLLDASRRWHDRYKTRETR